MTRYVRKRYQLLSRLSHEHIRPFYLCAYVCLLLIKKTHGQVLCKSCPVEFASYFHYCHSLTFDQRPDYAFVKRLFRDLFTREGIPWLSNTCMMSLILLFSYCSKTNILLIFNRLWVWLCLRLDSFEIQTRAKTKGMPDFFLCALFLWGDGADGMVSIVCTSIRLQLQACACAVRF